MRTKTILAALALAGVAALQSDSRSAPDAETFAVDPVHSCVLFRVGHLGVGAYYGRFNDVSGSFVVDDANGGAVEFTIDAASVDTNNQKRDDHLRSPDFFSVKEFSKITFKGKLTRKDGAKYQATGTLTLHGKSNEVTVDLERLGSGKDPWGGYRTGFEGSFTIKRSDYGMTNMVGAISDDVKLIVAIEGIRK